MGIRSEGAPAAANVEEVVSGLKVELGADDGELVGLELFEGLGFGEGGDDAGGVDHARAEEPGEGQGVLEREIGKRRTLLGTIRRSRRLLRGTDASEYGREKGSEGDVLS